MAPCPPISYRPYILIGDAKGAAQRGAALSRAEARTYSAHGIFGEFGVAVSLATSAVCENTTAPFGRRISHIFPLGSQEHVPRITAGRIIPVRAIMADAQVVRDRSVGKKPYYTVGSLRLSAHADFAISILVSIPRPRPAGIRASRLIHFRPDYLYAPRSKCRLKHVGTSMIGFSTARPMTYMGREHSNGDLAKRAGQV